MSSLIVTAPAPSCQPAPPPAARSRASPSRQRAGERTQGGWESWIGMLGGERERGTTNKLNYYFQILKAVNQEESKMPSVPLINWKDLVKKFMGEALPAVRPPEADNKNSWRPDQCCTIGHSFLTNTADTMSSPYVVSGIPDTWRMWSKWQWYYDICVSSTFVPLSLTTVKPTGQSWSQQSHTWKLNHRKWWKFKTGYNTSMCALLEFVVTKYSHESQTVKQHDQSTWSDGWGRLKSTSPLSLLGGSSR